MIDTGGAVIECGDCLDVMRGMDAGSVHSIVTDPPYGLSFMGKGWDHGVPGVPFWSEALRVAKPGAFLLAFGGTRTHHRLMCAIEDAGWEIRDCLMWLTGQGFPKSHDVSKAIDKAAGVEREVVGRDRRPIGGNTYKGGHGQWAGNGAITIPATDAAKRWHGWGTALKPSWEPVVMARKPLEGTVAGNVLKHGCGGINVDGCRIGDAQTTTRRNGNSGGNGAFGKDDRVFARLNPPGRFPANVILDEEAGAMLDAQAGERGGGFGVSGGDPAGHGIYGGGFPRGDMRTVGYGDSGGPSRFFYCPKASRSERDAGLEGMPKGRAGTLNMRTDRHSQANGMDTGHKHNTHPTVKPIALMRYLVRLVTPPDGVVLDPFMGSGTTGCAAMLEGFNFIGIEKEPAYAETARARIDAASVQPVNG